MLFSNSRKQFQIYFRRNVVVTYDTSVPTHKQAHKHRCAWTHNN